MSLQLQQSYQTSPLAPLADCTQASLQAMNCAANESATRYLCVTASTTMSKVKAGKAGKYYRHDPYAACVLAPEDTVEYLERHAGQCTACQATHPFETSMALLSMMERSSASQYDVYSPSSSSFIAPAVQGNTSHTIAATSIAVVGSAAGTKRPHFMLPQPQQLANPAIDSHSPAHSGNTTAFSTTTQDVSVMNSPSSYHGSAMSINTLACGGTITNNTNTSSSGSRNVNAAAGDGVGGSPTTTPMKHVARSYTGERTVSVHRRHYVEVKVDLRHSTPDYMIEDVDALFGADLEPSELMGRYVLVEGDRGEDMGCISAVLKSEWTSNPAAPSSPPSSEKAAEETTSGTTGTEKEGRGNKAGRPLPRVLRAATEDDIAEMELLMEEEAKALEHCQECLQRVRLHVPIVIEGVLFQFDRKKLVVRYTSDSYVDFNPLTRALHNHYKCRIWMDQLNRDLCEGVHERRRHYESKKRYFRGYGRRRE